MKSAVLSVKRASLLDCRAIAVYFYRLLINSSDFRSREETQVLLNELVARLGVRDQYRRVLKAFLSKLEAKKKLVPKKVPSDYSSPFDTRSKIPFHYQQDGDIYDNCGSFRTYNLDDINLCRIVFSGDEKNFAKVVGCTFFYEFAEEDFVIPREIKISSEFEKASKDISSVKFIKDALSISDLEAEFLNVAYRTVSIREMYDVVNDLCRDDMDRVFIYSTVMAKPRKDIRMILKSDGKLISFGFVDKAAEVDTDTVICIENQDFNLYFSDVVKKMDSRKLYSLESFSVNQEETDLAKRLMTNDTSTNLLLYGAVGSGKTEYARSLAKACGFTPLVYKNEMEVQDENSNKALYRLNCLLSLKQDNKVIIVDEAESVLKTIGFFFGYKYSLPQKGTVNKMLEMENVNNKVIWILNYTDELDESTLRRFTYSLRFNEMNKTMIQKIALSKLKPIEMSQFLRQSIVDLCGKYHITGSSIDNIVKTVKGMNCSKENEEQVIKDVKRVLEANSTLVYGKSKLREFVNKTYDLSVLNTTTPAAEMVEMVKNSIEYKSQMNDDNSGIRLLFYGLSGTGKTELVRYMADSLNKKILLKRVSDIMSKYVGENEQNIKAAFEEAEATDSILLFDEADSFFSDRSTASTGWERTLVNEFLTQMEEFNGILICTTNLRQIMDPALQRRFHIITEFLPLSTDGILKLVKSFFGSYNLTRQALEPLLKYQSVTPGDFGVLSSRIKFMPKSKVTADYIVDELVKIQEEKNGGRSIGFATE